MGSSSAVPGEARPAGELCTGVDKVSRETTKPVLGDAPSARKPVEMPEMSGREGARAMIRSHSGSGLRPFEC
jgi:hypothetical protein